MKNKFLLYLFSVFSFFLFSIDCKASFNINYGLPYQYINEKGLIYKHSGVAVDLTDKLNEISDVLNSVGMNYSINIKGIPYSEGSNYSMFNVFIYEYNTNNVDINYSATVDGSVIKVDTSSSLSNFITRGISISFPNPFSEASLNTILDNLITYIETNKHLPTASGNGYSYVGNSSLYIWGFPKMYFNDDGTLNSSSSNMYLFYDTNVSLNIKQTTNFDGFVINDNLYKVNSILPTYKDIYINVPKIYTEDYRINSKNIDRIEYTFKIPENELFMHEFNYSATWYSGVARLNLFNPPYLEYKFNNSIYDLPLDSNKSSTLDEVIYYDTQINSFQVGTTELKFIVDFNSINHLEDSSVFIHFDSSYPFSRNIIYVNDEDSFSNYYEELDFSGYYGVMLIPKLVENDIHRQVYSSIFYRGNNLDIRLYDSLDLTKEPIKYIHNYSSVGNVWGSFNYLFYFNNLNQILFFTKDNYLVDSEASIIKYNKRYFVYSLCKSSNSCDSIVNPNTDEEITIIPPDIVQDITEDDGGLFSMFHFFEKPIKFIFDGVGVLYNDYALPVVQKYWYFAFGFTVFVIILKLFF